MGCSISRKSSQGSRWTGEHDEPGVDNKQGRETFRGPILIGSIVRVHLRDQAER